jgi:hypothetical protein
MNTKNKLLLLPVIIFSVVVPLIVRAKNIEFTNDLYLVFTGVKDFADYFSYYKMVWIIIAMTLGILVFIIERKEKFVILKPNINKILLMMAAIVLLTGLLSDYKFITWFGFVDRYEGTIVCLAYIFFVIYIGTFFKDKKILKTVIFGIMLSSTVIALIGIMQAYGLNFFKSTLGENLVMTSNLIESGKSLQVAKNTLPTSTLYNINYVGSYMTMVLFVSIGYSIISDNIKLKSYGVINSILIFVHLIISKSAAGLLGTGISFLVLAIAVYRVYSERISRKVKVVSLATFIIIIAMLIPSFMREVHTIIEQSNKSSNVEDVDFIFNKSFVEFHKDSQKFKVMYKSNKLIFLFNDNEVYRKEVDVSNSTVKKNKSSIIQINQDFIKSHFMIKYNESLNALILNLKPSLAVVVELKEDELFLRDYAGRPMEFDNNIQSFELLEGHEFLGSSRGYIWKRSIPIMSDTIILGHGADTFPIYFPQNDLVEKRKYMGKAYMFIDKPHNMFIQMGINFGGLYLFLYVILIIIYIRESFILYLINRVNNRDDIIGVSLLCSVIGFNVAGIFNDSIVSVSPVYWTILGLGIAWNKLAVINE